MKVKLIVCLGIVGCSVIFSHKSVKASKVLVITAFSATSHMNIFWPLLDALQSRGHEVTVISSYTDEKTYPKIKQHYLNKSREVVERFNARVLYLQTTTIDPFEFIDAIKTHIKLLGDAFYNEPVITKMLEKKPSFDLIITDTLLNDYVLPLSNVLDAPIMYICTSVLDVGSAYANNVPAPFSYVPNGMLALPTKMNFMQRLQNTLVSTIGLIIVNFGNTWFEDAYSSYLPNAPSVVDLRGNVSFILVNSDPVIDVPRPSLPTVARIGGIHCRKPKPLPKDLEEFVQNAPDGVIVFSLGSVQKGDVLPSHVRDSFIEAFSRIKQKVIWKYDGRIGNLSPNVKLVTWMPQQDLLGHPKIKLFITHSGLLSLQETIYHGVPVIGVPLFGEQPQNSFRAVDLGFGERLLLSTLNADEIVEKITKVLAEKRYKEAVLKYSAIFKDQAMSPLDTAIYWTEYVIRHRGAHHLQTPAKHLNLLQYLLLDVTAVIGAAVALALMVAFTVLRFCLRLLLRKKQTPTKGKKD